QNYTRFKDPEADKAIDEAGATLDLEKRKAAYAKALKLLNQAYVIIWLYDRANIDAHRINVGGWQGNVWDEVTWNVEDWFLKKS
ncbi:MAG: peptide ABC transporter substrate-binding protein, partial [Candidatus Limnocylindria bacterium]